jgi:TolB-like protein
MKEASGTNDGAEAAARKFVRADSGGDALADAALAGGLAAHPDNERALPRVELAVELARRLAAEPSSSLYAEAARAAERAARRFRPANLLAWSGALAAALLIAVFIVRDRAPESSAPEPLAAARLIAFDAPSNAVAVLPSGAVVDASTVAVLPFGGPGDLSLAAGLGQDVVTSLRTVPGLYVIADADVRPYAGTELGTAELGGLLGARGLVDASVELVDGRVRVSATAPSSSSTVSTASKFRPRKRGSTRTSFYCRGSWSSTRSTRSMPTLATRSRRRHQALPGRSFRSPSR